MVVGLRRLWIAASCARSARWRRSKSLWASQVASLAAALSPRACPQRRQHPQASCACSASLERHVQQELFAHGDRPGHDGKRTHGGKRKGAGRPVPKGKRPSEPHKKRPAFKRSEPVLVTVRVVDDLADLRKRDAYKAIRRGMLVVYGEEAFHVVGVSIQGSHVHFLIEADDRMALARGMQRLQGSAAKHLNAAFSKRRNRRRRGRVFSDRYHERIIDNRRQARHALAYVLNNWRRHGEHRVKELRGFAIDPFSSALGFDGWRESFQIDWPTTYEPLPVWKPRTWLLTTGWRMYGLISPFETPGPKPKRYARATR